MCLIVEMFRFQVFSIQTITLTICRSSEVQKLVYISCDAKAAMQNFLTLGQLPSNLYRGDPFIPKRIIPVDLFPHTPHFELVMFFERFPLMQLVAEKEAESVSGISPPKTTGHDETVNPPPTISD